MATLDADGDPRDFLYTGMTTSTARPVRGLTVDFFGAFEELPADLVSALDAFPFDLRMAFGSFFSTFVFSTSAAASRYDLPFNRLVGANS